MTGISGDVSVIGVGVDEGDLLGTLPGPNDIGSLLCLAGEMGNSYLVWLGSSKVNVGNETVRILFAAF